ncbi:MAG: hypothetical protein AAGA87_14740 [Pseudomonadota bacterium]
MKKLLLSSAVLLAISSAAPAQQAPEEIQELLLAFLDEEIRAWAEVDVLTDAIRAQNEVTRDYTQERIDSLDAAWQASVGTPDIAVIADVVQNDAADYLRQQVEQSYGMVSEVFVMDARGLNVAASQPTSDYWQGDEDKYISTFMRGSDAVHMSDIEYDDSTQSYLAQLSFTINDPETGDPIGAITVGVDASLF